MKIETKFNIYDHVYTIFLYNNCEYRIDEKYIISIKVNGVNNISYIFSGGFSKSEYELFTKEEVNIIADYIDNHMKLDEFKINHSKDISRAFLDKINKPTIKIKDYKFNPSKISKRTIYRMVYGDANQLNEIKEYLHKDKLKYNVNGVSLNCLDKGVISFEEFILTDNFCGEDSSNMTYNEWVNFLENDGSEIIFKKYKGGK